MQPAEPDPHERHWGPMSVAIAVGVLLAAAAALAILERSRRSARRESHAQALRLRSLFLESRTAQVVTDDAGSILDVNAAACRLLGLRPQSAIGVSLDTRTHTGDLAGAARHRADVAAGSAREDIREERYVRGDGTTVWCSVSRSPLGERGDRPRVLTQLHDISGWKKVEAALAEAHAELDRRTKERTAALLSANDKLRREASERVAFEKRLEHLALHDPLTGLANRTLFLDRLTQALRGLRRKPGVVTLLYIDLDRFKLVNDGFGHAIGDRLLVGVGRRLEAALRPRDTVARLGGDEFAVLVEHGDGGEAGTEVAQRVLETLTALRLEDVDVTASASIGVVSCTDPDAAAEEILQDADMAMYEAKQHGRGQWVVFDDRLRRRAMDRLHIEGGLRRAVRAGELEVHYQPQIDLRDGRLHGVEALLRWRRPDGAVLPASAFIDVAEEAWLIADVGSWAFDRACLDAEAWRSAHPEVDVRLQVNLSARELVRPDLVRTIESTLARTDTDPSSLSLEITERVLVEDPDRVMVAVRDLMGLGIRLGIDDFGTRYSSLTNLKLFTLDSVKINESFVGGLGSNDVDSAIVSAIIGLAHDLGIQVIAEGVETREQLLVLRDLDCEIAQGWLFGSAETASHIDRLLAAEATHPGWIEATAICESVET
ncbi:MAG: EAL domain-containing protein [Acidimicrobiia bacterium]|nr:EAL domain-containing protein [Acidimicrobiia bacterium]